MNRILVASLGLATVVAWTSSAAAGAAAPAPAPKPGIEVSPASAKPGAAVRVNVTCGGKITAAPSSGALVGLTKVPTVAAPHASWKAKVSPKAKAGAHAVSFACDGHVSKANIRVQHAAPSKAAKKPAHKPRGAVRTGGGGTAQTWVDHGSLSNAGHSSRPDLHHPPQWAAQTMFGLVQP